MKASFTDCSVLRVSVRYKCVRNGPFIIADYYDSDCWLMALIASLARDRHHRQNTGVVQVVKTYFPYRFRADAGELVRAAGVLVRYQLGRVVPGHVGSRPSATHLGPGKGQNINTAGGSDTHTHSVGMGKRCKSKFNYSNLFNLLALRHAIIYRVAGVERKRGPRVKTLGHFRFGWVGNWLTLHWSKTLVPCTV